MLEEIVATLIRYLFVFKMAINRALQVQNINEVAMAISATGEKFWSDVNSVKIRGSPMKRNLMDFF